MLSSKPTSPSLAAAACPHAVGILEILSPPFAISHESLSSNHTLVVSMTIFSPRRTSLSSLNACLNFPPPRRSCVSNGTRQPSPSSSFPPRSVLTFCKSMKRSPSLTPQKKRTLSSAVVFAELLRQLEEAGVVHCERPSTVRKRGLAVETSSASRRGRNTNVLALVQRQKGIHA